MRKVLLTALIAAAPAGAFAAGLEDLVEARRGYYKMLGANMAGLSAMAKGDVEYDGARAETLAGNLKIMTQYNIGHLYAPGTSNADMPGKTRALPAIWEDQAGVGEKGMAYVQAVNELNEVAGLDKAEMGKALQKVGGTCKGCHDDYRAKDF
ncbi:cytochrome c556 [Rhodovulum bhavnagarense]|uniref:Cytochrome c556 n=1 Tax=Rhodovulum bhavnagarense TaxID=992286 RepID=A0A4V2SWC8_9RHOB|nr:cytochrome c [Rhodovulum bhavnagarense]TCP61976.1 cytochrome c556 [Rhodovulum bhavnagarense]